MINVIRWRFLIIGLGGYYNIHEKDYYFRFNYFSLFGSVGAAIACEIIS
jgi:hypothetical protein